MPRTRRAPAALRPAAALGGLLLVAALLPRTAAPAAVASAPVPEDALAASALVPLEPRCARFRLIREEGGERTVPWERLPGHREGTWRTGIPGFHAALLRRGEDGSLEVLEHLDHGDDARVGYDPPALLLPADLGEEGVARSESAVVVRNLSDGSRRAEGRCRHRVELLGRETVEVPAGRFEAVRVAIHRSLDVPVAHAEVRVELALVPGRGRVREHLVERVSMLGVTTQRHVHTLELVREEPTRSGRCARESAAPAR